jgi:hypothetical protein
MRVVEGADNLILARRIGDRRGPCERCLLCDMLGAVVADEVADVVVVCVVRIGDLRRE